MGGQTSIEKLIKDHPDRRSYSTMKIEDTDALRLLVKQKPWESKGVDLINIEWAQPDESKPITATIDGFEFTGHQTKNYSFCFAIVLHSTPYGVGFTIKGHHYRFSPADNLAEKIDKDNRARGWKPERGFIEAIKWLAKHDLTGFEEGLGGDDDDVPSVEVVKTIKRLRPPASLPQPTFYEARTGATAISDGRDLRDWQAMEGMIAMLHAPKNSIMQTRFEPCALLLSWWGNPSGAQLEMLQSELQNLEFDALVTYFVCLSWTIEEYQVTTSIDSIIEAIGRGTDARRSTKTRAMWRSKVWRWMLLFDSVAVIGARRGTWKEPSDGDKKREKVDPDKLYSRDALLKIIGTRDTDQGTFDNSAPPKEVSFVAGAWVNQWRGNREILSEFGNVRAIASIPRGKPSGAWAACIGFALQQKWREQASKTPVTRITKGEKKMATQKFRPFTRRALLAQLWRSDVDPDEILKSSDPSRAKEYWDAAIEILQKEGIIGIYKEVPPLPAEREGWQDAWLDQPLDIRPTGDNWKDAITISKSATAARKRGRKKSAPKETPKTD